MVIQKQNNIKEKVNPESQEDCPIKKAIKNNKDRLSKMGVKSVEEEEKEKEKKKSKTEIKKTYKAILKIAIIFGLVLLCSLIYNFVFSPNIVDAILVFLRGVFPSFSDSAGMEHFVN